MSTTKRRCLLIGHDLVLLDDLRYLLEPDFELLAAPVDSDAALSAAATFGPDTVIIDADNAEISLRIGESLREVNPDLTVTYLTSEIAPSWRSRGVSKTQPASEFLRAFRALFPRRGSAAEQKPTATLSDREREVLTLLVRGMSMKEAARKLGISPRTVAFHKYKSMEVNGLRNNADLIRFALSHKILPNLAIFVVMPAGRILAEIALT